MAIHELETENGFQQATTGNKTVLVDFFATWCAPCKALEPFIEKFSEEDKYSGVYFSKINVDKLSKLCDDLDIQAMPTIMILRDGKEVEKLVDPKPTDLVALLERWLS